MLESGQHRPYLSGKAYLTRAGLPLGAAFPPLHPCWKAGQLAMFSREFEVWIFMYNLLILMLAINFFPPKNSGKDISTAMCWNQASVSAGLYFSPRVGSALGSERNLIHIS